ncbi:MAG: glycosyltransferase [Pseudomonadota bacterium]
MENLITVIVPVYNAEQYLHQCLSSVVCQTYRNIEVVLVDDGSTDGGSKIYNEYALDDNRIKIIRTENNGPASARNRAIKIARGEFLFFLDADDFLERDSLAVLIEWHKETGADVIIGGFNKIRNDHSVVPQNIYLDKQLLDLSSVARYAMQYLERPNRFLLFAYSWGRLFKTSIVEDNNILFDAALHTFEDVKFNFAYLQYAKKVFYSDKIVYNHLAHDNYASATMAVCDNPKKLLGYQQALNGIEDFLKSQGVNEGVRKQKMGHAYIYLTIIQLVRLCGQITTHNRGNIFLLVKQVINDPLLQVYLPCYSPSGKDSRVLPALMKLKLTSAIIWLCQYKAQKRYQKAGVVGTCERR